MIEATGKRVWVFPDLELPPPGEFELKGHESLIILNTSDKTAHIDVTLYFDDRDPVKGIKMTVEPERVRCFRTNNPEDMDGFVVPLETQYAMKVESDIEIVAQYGRLDTRQTNMAFYTVMGFSK